MTSEANKKDSQTCCITNIAMNENQKAETLVIPDTINGLKVTKLGAQDNKEVSIFGLRYSDESGEIIPSSLRTKINQIKMIRIPGTVKTLNCIYSKKSGRLVAANILSKKIVIPNQVICLKMGTSFAGEKLEKIVVPATVKKVGNYWSSGVNDEFELIFQGTKAPIFAKESLNSDITVYVPAKSYAKYKKKIRNISYGENISIQVS